MKVKYLILITISGAVIALDQLTKMYIHTQYRVGESVSVIRDYFNITYVRNPGAAFGILAQAHPEFREWFFLLLPPAALVVIYFILRSVEDKDRIQILALSSIFGGAIGNYIDRLRFRYVIDFLDFHLKNIYSWPAFNVADSAIVVGIGVLIYLSFARKETAETDPNSLQTASTASKTET
jgi:signal peptidase II